MYHTGKYTFFIFIIEIPYIMVVISSINTAVTQTSLWLSHIVFHLVQKKVKVQSRIIQGQLIFNNDTLTDACQKMGERANLTSSLQVGYPESLLQVHLSTQTYSTTCFKSHRSQMEVFYLNKVGEIFIFYCHVHKGLYYIYCTYKIIYNLYSNLVRYSEQEFSFKKLKR